MQKWLKGELKAEENDEIERNYIKLWVNDETSVEKSREKYVKEKNSKYEERIEEKQENVNLREEYVKEIERAFNIWRRNTCILGIYLKIVYLKFGKILIDKLKQSMNVSGKIKNRRALKGKKENIKIYSILFSLSQRMGIEIASSIANVKFFFKERSNFNSFFEAFDNMTKSVQKIKIEKDSVKNETIKFPKIKRVIWVIRHSQRLDNDDKIREEAEKGDRCFRRDERIFELDNSPLSVVGKERASRLQQVFKNIPINHIFASPYERTTETALHLLQNNHKNRDKKFQKILINELKIKLEPGFIEKLSALCGNEATGYEDCKQLERHHKRLNCEYNSILSREEAEKYKKQENRRWDIACIPRIENVFTKLLDENNSYLNAKFNQEKLVKRFKNGEVKSEWLIPGEEDAEHILIVTHAMVVISMEQMLMGRYTFTPQASITKIIELDENDKFANGVTEKIKNLRMIYSGVTVHLDKKLKDIYFEH
ncbi:hypothetical protein Mgra_00009556 [Meloidogyne graminicola]|uniref:Uncharacterized protein n=1 Tax=Meloidogyne graminicola TaxID=189291 RepID=A0A8S9Z9N7_9BILA|nr:hypothetical protein Mgra_00009556 [Meloidogyne graminicola]